MISAAASAPPRSSSNKRISFNLVTTGASHRTAADLSSEKSPRPPTLKSRDKPSDLRKFRRVCLAERSADVTFTTASTVLFSFNGVTRRGLAVVVVVVVVS